MKRNILKTITFLLVLFLGISFICSCKQKGTAKAEIVEKSDVVVVIKINETEGFAHLIDAMKYLKEKGLPYSEKRIGNEFAMNKEMALMTIKYYR